MCTQVSWLRGTSSLKEKEKALPRFSAPKQKADLLFTFLMVRFSSLKPEFRVKFIHFTRECPLQDHLWPQEQFSTAFFFSKKVKGDVICLHVHDLVFCSLSFPLHLFCSVLFLFLSRKREISIIPKFVSLALLANVQLQ